MKKPFPKLPEKLDRRKKMTVEQIGEMGELLKSGFSKRYIAKKFNINVSAVCYHLNGDEYKQNWIEKSKKLQKKYRETADGKIRHTENVKSSLEYKKQHQEAEYREWNRLYHLGWRGTPEGRKKWREYNKKYRQKLK